MKQTKGFTLVEVIICIALISIVSTTSIILLNKKNNQNIDVITKKILEAANVFINTEKDKDGKNYLKEINNGKNAVQLPLKVLVNKGYIDESYVNKIYNHENKQNKDDDLYVMFLNTSSDDYCNNTQITTLASWTKNTDPIYLCSTNESNSDNQAVIEKIIEKPINIYKHIFPKLKNCDNDFCMWINYNTTPNNVYGYFKGNVNNNYIEVGTDSETNKPLLWRIVWIRDDGSMKLALNDVISPKIYDKNNNLIEIADKDIYCGSTNTNSDVRRCFIGTVEDRNNIPLTGYYFNGYSSTSNYDSCTGNGCKIHTITNEFNQKFKFSNDDFFSPSQQYDEVTSKLISSYLKYWFKKNKLNDITYIKKTKTFCRDVASSLYNYSSYIDCRDSHDEYYIQNSELEDLEIGTLTNGELIMTGLKDANQVKHYLYNDKAYMLEGTNVSSSSNYNLVYNPSNGLKNIELGGPYTFDNQPSHYILEENIFKRIQKTSYFNIVYTKPSIILDINNIKMSGDGSKDNPYKITK